MCGVLEGERDKQKEEEDERVTCDLLAWEEWEGGVVGVLLLDLLMELSYCRVPSERKERERER